MNSRELARSLITGGRGFKLPEITPHVQCHACAYHWAYAVSPHVCPSCGHSHFSNWTPPPEPAEVLTALKLEIARDLGMDAAELEASLA